MSEQTARRKLTRELLGAWMVKCNPRLWDVARYRDDHERVTRWSVQDNYRSALMAPGDTVFLWVTGSVGATPTPGVWGVGAVTGKCEWIPASEDDVDYWIGPPAYAGKDDPDSGLHLSCPVDIPFALEPVTREDVVGDPMLSGLEVIRSAQMGSPLFVDADQTARLVALLGESSEAVTIDRAQLVAHVESLAGRIGSEAGIDASEYLDIARASDPAGALRALVMTGQASTTFLALYRRSRLDLSLERLIIDAVELHAGRDLVRAAQDRLNYYDAV